MHGWWWLTVDGLAVFRLTLLVTRDTITAGVRERLRRRAFDETPTVSSASLREEITPPFHAAARWLHQLVTCPWCISVWIAAPVVAVTALVPLVWQYAAAALALSAVAGFLAERS